MKFKNEHELTDFLERELKEMLSDRILRIGSRINVGSTNFYKIAKLHDNWPSLLSQPEIDLVILYENVKRSNIAKSQLLGVQIKLFRKESKSSFYGGLGQSLASLRFGFDAVFLWHFFEQEYPSHEVEKYEGNTRFLIEKLDLPIKYSAFRIEEINQNVKFKLIPKGTLLGPFELYGILNGKINPFLDLDQVKVLKSHVRKILEIPNGRYQGLSIHLSPVSE